MAGILTAQSLKNVPTQTVTVSTITPLLVPASGLYSGYPSPVLPSGSGFVLISDPSAQSNNPTATTPTYTNSLMDGQPFVLRAVLEVATAASYTFIGNIYQVPQTTLINNASSTLGSSTLSNDHNIVTGATLTLNGKGQYVLETQLLWDSVSGKLNGVFDTITDATYTGPAANTAQLTSVGPNDLNFLLAFTFGTANAANSVTVKEFSLNIL
jgi:hypothetical protein